MLQIIFVGANPAGIAARHATVLKRIAEISVCAVVDINLPRATGFARQFGWTAPVYASLPEALHGLQAQGVKPDYVVLLTPREVREELILECIRHCLPVFMEKPPCHTLSAGNRIAAALSESQLLHAVAFPHRHNEALAHALDLLKGQPLTQVNLAIHTPMATNPPAAGVVSLPHLWERSGGLVGDQGIHYVDLARYVCGSDVKRILAAHGTCVRGATSPEFTSVDTASWLFEMESGQLVTHTHSWLTPHWSAMLELVTRKSVLRVSLYANRVEGVADGQRIAFAGKTDEYEFELEHRLFAQAVQERSMTPVRCNYPDALASFRMAAELNRMIYGSTSEL